MLSFTASCHQADDNRFSLANDNSFLLGISCHSHSSPPYTVARGIFLKPGSGYDTPLLKNLQWLPVKYRLIIPGPVSLASSFIAPT